MIAYRFDRGKVAFSSYDFDCPYCKKVYSDKDSTYLGRVNRNRKKSASIMCECGNRFHMTYDYIGNAMSYFVKKGRSNKWDKI
jgi:hypothetical protein